jgi:lipopolysaccharide biosynthesis glycosyltransferase
VPDGHYRRAVPGTAIVFGVDDGFVLPLGVALRSLVANSPAALVDTDVIVLHEELAPASVSRLRCHAEALGDGLRLVPWRLRDEGYRTAPNGTRANSLRLFMDRVLPEHGRALYLDCDLLILDDLAPLLATDMGGLPLAAVRDPFQPTYGRSGLVMPGWQELGIPPDREYFNSGVMLFDLETCRRERLFDRAIRFLTEHPEHVGVGDQDALNLAVDDRWLRLDRAWNTAPMSAVVVDGCMAYGMDDVVPLQTLVDEEPAARVMHYMTQLKPWRAGYPVGPALRRYGRFLLEARAAEVRAGIQAAAST